MSEGNHNRAREALAITDAAGEWIRAHLEEKAQERLVFRVGTLPTRIGFAVQVGFDMASRKEPRREEFEGIPVVVSPDDWKRLAGFTIDIRDGRLVARAGVTVHAKATANPESRLFSLNRTVAAGGSAAYDRNQAEAAPLLAQLLFRLDGVESLVCEENLVTVTRGPGASWTELEPSVEKTLQAYFAHGGRELTGDAVGDPG